VLDAGDSLQGCTQVVGPEVFGGAAEFVQHQLEPEFRGLVLDDEQHLVMVLRRADGPLGAEQRGQLKIRPVTHSGTEIADDPLVQFSGVLLHGHSVAFLANYCVG
jgi:hypothetical protein